MNYSGDEIFTCPRFTCYEKGAFTDAKDRKMGLFEVGSGGTIFLDEI